MKHLASCALLTLILGTAGCGTIGFANGPDKAALAKKAVESYWNYAGHGKINQAYSMLTPGVRESLPKSQYAQNMIGLLTRAGSITAKANKAYVSGDQAQVRLTLYSPKDKPFPAWQHLFWLNGGWHISDNNAYVSQHR